MATKAKAKTKTKPTGPAPLTSSADFVRRLDGMADLYRQMAADRADREEQGFIPPDLTQVFLPLQEFGVYFDRVQPVREDDVLKSYFRRRRAVAKECYSNCQEFILCDEAGHATYYEGYVQSGPDGRFIVHHAWLVVAGVVFDPTAEAADRKLRRMRFGADRYRVYFGLPFTQQHVAVHVCEHDMYSPLMGPVPSTI
jgi:hypothetical protein